MRQDRDEMIRSFGVRLRGQAGFCKFLVTCPACNAAVIYTKNVLWDILMRGLAESEIQQELPGDRNQGMSLKEVFTFIQAKEAVKRSADHLSQSQGVHAAKSQYRCAKTRSNYARLGTTMSSAPTATNTALARVPQPGFEELTALLMAQSAISVGGRTTLEAYVVARAKSPDRSSPPHLVAILGKQKMPYATCFALQPT